MVTSKSEGTQGTEGHTEARGRQLTHGELLELRRWNCEVEVFGRKVLPGQLIHADKHGFLVIPEEDEARLLEAARMMDTNECQTLIAAAKESAGMTAEEILDRLDGASAQFRENIKSYFKQQGKH